MTAKLKFIPVNKPQSTIIWSKGIQAKKGQVISSEEERRFIINFVTFDDQGNYTELNVLDEVEVVHSVMVLCKYFSCTHFSHFFSVPFVLISLKLLP